MSSTPLTATVELQSCVEGACVTIEVICRGIYVICFDIIRYMNISQKQDYVVSFCNDGKNFLYSTVDSGDRCKRQMRIIMYQT